MKRTIALILTAYLTGCGGTSTHSEPVDGSHAAPHAGHAIDPQAAQTAQTALAKHEPGDADASAHDGHADAAAADADAHATQARAVDAPAPVAEPPAEMPWFEAVGHLGRHTLAWRPIDQGKVPRNAPFDMDVLVTRDGEPADVQLDVTGWMPAHSHGLVQMPVVESLGDGRHRVSGMLLHMRGAWQVRFSIIADRSLETVTFDLTL